MNDSHFVWLSNITERESGESVPSGEHSFFDESIHSGQHPPFAKHMYHAELLPLVTRLQRVNRIILNDTNNLLSVNVTAQLCVQ